MRETAVGLVKKAVDESKTIAVVGWIPSNHNRFTRALEECKRVMFLRTERISIPKEVGLVLLTRFVSHQVIKEVSSKGHDVFNGAFNIGEIKRMLNLIKLPSSSLVLPTSGEPFVTGSMIAQVESVVEVIGQKFTDWEGFRAEFLSLGVKHPYNWVGKKEFAKLRERFNIRQSPERLVYMGWVVPNVSPGKQQIGWYSAGEKMGVPGRFTSTQTETQPVVSVSDETRIQKMIRLLSEEPEIQAKLEHCRARRAEIDKEEAELQDRLARGNMFRESVDAIEDA